MKDTINWKEKIVSAAESHWVVSIEQNKKIKSGARRFEFTASSITKISDKSMSLKIKKMIFFPISFEAQFENMVGLSTYFRRGNPLQRHEILKMIEKPEFRKVDRKKASFRKWTSFSVILLAIFSIAALIVIFTH